MGNRAGESSELRTEQNNIRLTRTEQDVLEAVAYLEEIDKSDILHDLVSDFLGRRFKDDGVRRMVEQREERRGQRDGSVSRLKDRKPSDRA